ncbi:hypothetical protein HJD18_00115 [Thermoleophilia bacterium SCSIO 60948]|nr:hypothetical protein HJD18_00115 [Thermoleophilia bacterium SCSIO 60948]
MSAIRSAFRFLAGTVLVIFLAVAVPLGWVWVGSQVQGGTSPAMTAIVTVIAGLVVTYSLVGLIAAWAKGRSEPDNRGPTRYEWNRSMRDERHTPASTSFLENVLIVTTILVAIIVTVWFFLFGDPGVPGG